MKIKMIKGLHLTAANKKHIAYMLENDMKEAGNKTYSYSIDKIEGNTAHLTLTIREKNDMGKPIVRKGQYVVEFGK